MKLSEIDWETSTCKRIPRNFDFSGIRPGPGFTKFRFQVMTLYPEIFVRVVRYTARRMTSHLLECAMDEIETIGIDKKCWNEILLVKHISSIYNDI